MFCLQKGLMSMDLVNLISSILMEIISKFFWGNAEMFTRQTNENYGMRTNWG